jgi:hypothetical protein
MSISRVSPATTLRVLLSSARAENWYEAFHTLLEHTGNDSACCLRLLLRFAVSVLFPNAIRLAREGTVHVPAFVSGVGAGFEGFEFSNAVFKITPFKISKESGLFWNN